MIAEMAKAAFGRTWAATGEIELVVIGPVSAWNLPDGYRYDRTTDAIVGPDGKPVADVSEYQTRTLVRAVPARQIGGGQAVTHGGMVTTGNAAFAILLADRDALRSAWGVLYDGELWSVAEIPVTVPSALCRVELERR